MFRIHKKVALIFLYLVVLNSFNCSVSAENINVDFNKYPKSSKKIRLNLKNKPLSIAIKKLSKKANMDIIIASDFQDDNISVNLSNVSIKDAFENLMSIGNFSIKEQNGIISIKPIEKINIITESFVLINADGAKVAKSIKKLASNKKNSNVEYYNETNTIVLSGEKSFINKSLELINTLDIPKKHSSFNLKHHTSAQVARILDEMIFQDRNIQKTKQQKTLAPVFDEKLGFVIKGMIEKHEGVLINTERPKIIPENNNEITIIGNEYQIALAKEYIEYIEGKKIDKDEEIRQAHNKLYNARNELKKVKNELTLLKQELDQKNPAIQKMPGNDQTLKETQLQLSDSLIEEINKDLEIKELNQEINQLKDIIARNSNINPEKQVVYRYIKDDKNVKKLKTTVSKLKKELNNKEAKLKEKEKVIKGLNNEITSYRIRLKKAQQKSKAVEKVVYKNTTDDDVYKNLRKQLSQTTHKLEKTSSLLEKQARQVEGLEQELFEKDQQIESLKNKPEIIEKVVIKSHNNNKEIETLHSEINLLEDEIKRTKAVLKEKSKFNKNLLDQISEKERELELANSSLKNLKAELTELKLKSSLNIEKANTMDEFKYIASTLNELKQTKVELHKVKKQLDISKKQLELIFGGKLLDENVIPEGNSVWFK